MQTRLLTYQLRLNFLLFIFAFLATTSTVAQEKPQPQKRWVRWRLIEVARNSLADSILAQLQQGVSFQKLARQHSLHASAKEGGEIGWAALDSVDSDFKTTIASLPIGGTSAIRQKGKHFFILYKMNELSESGYLQWKEQKAEVDSLINRGDAYQKSAQYRKARVYYDSALVVAREIGDQRGEGRALGSLGTVYFSLGQHRQATTYYDSALSVARKIEDQDSEGKTLGNLGNVYGALSQYPQAIAYSDSSLIIARKLGDHNSEKNALNSLGVAYYVL